MAHPTFRGKVNSVLSGNVPFGQSEEAFGEYSPKAFSGKVNFSEMGISHFIESLKSLKSTSDGPLQSLFDPCQVKTEVVIKQAS